MSPALALLALVLSADQKDPPDPLQGKSVSALAAGGNTIVARSGAELFKIGYDRASLLGPVPARGDLAVSPDGRMVWVGASCPCGAPCPPEAAGQLSSDSGLTFQPAPLPLRHFASAGQRLFAADCFSAGELVKGQLVPFSSPSLGFAADGGAGAARPLGLFASGSRVVILTTDRAETVSLALSTDAGKSFEVRALPGLSAPLTVLFDGTPQRLYLFTGAQLLRSDDGARKLSVVAGPGGHLLDKVLSDPRHPGLIYGSLGRQLYSSHDGGDRWLPLIGGPSSPTILALALGRDRIYVRTAVGLEHMVSR